jgi:hypothetical protein
VKTNYAEHLATRDDRPVLATRAPGSVTVAADGSFAVELELDPAGALEDLRASDLDRVPPPARMRMTD